MGSLLGAFRADGRPAAELDALSEDGGPFELRVGEAFRLQSYQVVETGDGATLALPSCVGSSSEAHRSGFLARQRAVPATDTRGALVSVANRVERP